MQHPGHTNLDEVYNMQISAADTGDANNADGNEVP